jgi:3-hydroxyacyl-CoA dehydrogenase / enoyl-CoA hydratase / 3-hydroxybutyryl-CoA epimerase
MSDFIYSKDQDNIVTITMDMAGQSVNTMNDAYGPAMREVLGKIEADKANIRGIILTSAKSTFFAGGDLKNLLANTDRKAAYDQSMEVKHQLRKLETFGIPVVAAINGAALGGGFEIALACHYRIALAGKATQIGLPEVSLGLLPGGGGVVRMVRLLGLQNATPFLLEGKKVDPAGAKKAGIIHEVVDTREELLTRAKAWLSGSPAAVQPWDQPNYRIPGGTGKELEVQNLVAFACANIGKTTRGLMPAPKHIMSAAVESTMVDFDTACRIESRYFADLAVSSVAKNLITTFFFQMNELNAGGSRPKGFEKTGVKKVGVLGAGMMGAGIAYSSAIAGIDVVLKDVSAESAQKGKNYSVKLLDGQVAKGRMDEAKKNSILDRIKPTGDNADLAGCDLIIEAVFEDIELKGKVTKEAEAVNGDKLTYASNTSTLPITLLANASVRPEKFIGLHFFSPVDKMPLVEIICGEKTSDETLAKAFDYVQQIKKTPIVVNDSRGFFTSRVFGTFIDEGCILLTEGVDAMVIENLSRHVGMPVGPLASQDEVSQQLAVKITETNRKLDEQTGTTTLGENTGYRVAKRLIDDFNRKGKAHGGGFYDYPEGGKKSLWPELAKIYGKADHGISTQDIKDRILYRQAIEAVRCIEEGVLKSVRDGNIGSVFGIGFPQWTGGQLQFINSVGLREFVKRAKALADRYGERFTPPKLLLDKAEKGETFKD